MTDLEIRLLCAEAMGYAEVSPPINCDLVRGIVYHAVGNCVRLGSWVGTEPDNVYSDRPYDPLHNDAQAMALVKKFRLDVYGYPSYWAAVHDDGSSHARADNTDLNRAICECVAKMQKEKP